MDLHHRMQALSLTAYDGVLIFLEKRVFKICQ
jgi:hypothetical protein